MTKNRLDLTHNLFLPTLFFAALGGMGWAVRGSSGFGAVPGCLFAGVLWGAGWWYLARDPSRQQSRRYASGWIVLAVTLGIGLSGARGWMQWGGFFGGTLTTNWQKQESVPIPRFYGFLWFFIAGMPWAGLGACALAWCGSLRETRVWHWMLRIGFGLAGAILLRFLYRHFPQYFLPLYDSLQARYDYAWTRAKTLPDPNLLRLITDCGSALTHLGYYLGFLLFEIVRRDWKNAVLILTVGTLNGTGWALCQTWNWAHEIWPDSHFNFWRCWESSGGISIGIAYGIAYFLVNRPMSATERAVVASRRAISGPNFEWLLVHGGLAFFLSIYLLTQLPRGDALPPALTSFLSVPVRSALSWRGIYFAVVLAFGAAYYLAYRGGSALSIHSLFSGVLALLFSGVLIAGLFITPNRMLELDRYAEVLGRPGRDQDLILGIDDIVNLIMLAIVMAVGLACYLAFYRSFQAEKDRSTPIDGDPNIERWGLALGLLTGLGLSLRNGLKGWYNVYKGVEGHWAGGLWRSLGIVKPDEQRANLVLWQYLGTVFLVGLVILALWILLRPVPRNDERDPVPGAYGLIWLVLIVQNVIALFITGPLNQWNEMTFEIYYVLLFFITAAIVVHYHLIKQYQSRAWQAPAQPTA